MNRKFSLIILLISITLLTGCFKTCAQTTDLNSPTPNTQATEQNSPTPNTQTTEQNSPTPNTQTTEQNSPTPITTIGASKNDNDLSNKIKLDTLVENGLHVFENQSFDVNLENYGNVRFVSGEVDVDGFSKLRLYLVNNSKEIIYTFPDFYGNILTSLEEVDAVSFRDLNKDGLKDITIIAYYIAANGDELPMAGVYFQKDMDFIHSDELDTEINSTNNNTTIDSIKKFLNKLNLSTYGIK